MSINTFQDWQTNVAPFLTAIAMRSVRIQSDIQKMDPLVKVLQGKDIPFETKAEEELEKARVAALDLLNSIEGLQSKMRGVHVTAANWAGYEADARAAR
jgi:hypothetical protein